MTATFKQFWGWFWQERRVPGLRWLPSFWGSLISLILVFGVILAISHFWLLHLTGPSSRFFQAVLKNPFTWLMIFSIYLYNVQLEYLRYLIAKRTGKRFSPIPFGNPGALITYKEIFGKDAMYGIQETLRWLIIVHFLLSVIPVLARARQLMPNPAGSVTVQSSGNIIHVSNQVTDKNSYEIQWIGIPLVLTLIAFSVARYSKDGKVKAIAWGMVAFGLLFVVIFFIAYI